MEKEIAPSPYQQQARSERPLRSQVVTVDGKTLADVYLRRVELSGEKPAFLVKKAGAYRNVTWNKVHAQVLALYRALVARNLKRGDRICILSQSRAEWVICDLTNFCSGFITVPIYPSSTIEDMAYILDHSGAKLVFVEEEALLAKVREACRQVKVTPLLVHFEPVTKNGGGDREFYFSEFAPLLNKEDSVKVEAELRESSASLEPSDVASIVYTSGTTGQPKGAVLLHSNFAAEIRAIVGGFELGREDVTLTFLPLSHILGRVESLISIFGGVTLGFAENINAVTQNLQEVRPTLLVSVPRIYEKIYSKIQSDVASQPKIKQAIFKWSSQVGREVARLRSAKKPIPLILQLKYQVADNLVFTKVREKLGGRIRMTVSGGAPLAPELCEFFHACGIKIMEGYGLTETTAAITVNRLDDYVFGSVGRALGPTEIRIAEDGEILLKTPTIFKEYYRNPEATKDAFTSDGWFCTGDIGQILPGGFLKITDRKKELIVTSAGKNIAPQKIENLLKQSRFISQAMVYGDKQKYLVALITMNEQEVKVWANGQGLSASSEQELCREPKVIELIDAEIAQMNQQLASYETIKKFSLLPHDFGIETGELTPSLKVKRKFCTQKFRAQIDAMYK